MKHAGPAEQGLGVAGGADDASAGFPALRPAPSETVAAVIKVLAIDDDFICELVHRVLAADGMQVESYGSAADLLVAGHLASAAVLLLDVRMPGMSGLELQDLLRRRGIDLPVVFVSGCADLAMAVTAIPALRPRPRTPQSPSSPAPGSTHARRASPRRCSPPPG